MPVLPMWDVMQHPCICSPWLLLRFVKSPCSCTFYAIPIILYIFAIFKKNILLFSSDMHSVFSFCSLHSLIQLHPLSVWLVALLSTKVALKSTTTDSGRLCVMTHGTSEKLRWSVGSWDMGVQYQHWVMRILGKDQVLSGMSTGTALGVNPICKAAELVVQVAATMKMPQ